MSEQKTHGDWAEDEAVQYLHSIGYEVVERNWRFKRAEIDIIARHDRVLVFIEVKMKAYIYYGRPEEMVDQRKRRLIIDAAMAYMRSIGYEWEIRFDIISIVGRPEETFSVTHYLDAFFPGLDYGRLQV